MQEIKRQQEAIDRIQYKRSLTDKIKIEKNVNSNKIN